MASMNRVILAGNLTRDPEGRRLTSGTAVCNLGLAVNRRYRTSSGELSEETTFVDIEVWGRQAEFCRDYLRKGAPILLEGRLKLDSWEDRNTGQKRSKLRVVAERVQSLGRGDGSDDGYQSQGGYSQDSGGYDQGGQGYDQGGQGGGNWGGNQPQSQPRPPQQQRPAPPPFPNDQPAPGAGNNTSNSDDAFDVSDESIDDIPF